MAALRCVARRIGDSLLKRWKTQATVSPSRIMRSLGFHSEVPSERAHRIQQKKAELRDLVSKAAQTHAELNVELLKAVAANYPKAIGEIDWRLLHHIPLSLQKVILLQHLSLQQVVPKPKPTLWTRCTELTTMVSKALVTTATVAYLGVLTGVTVTFIRENSVKTKAVHKENHQ